MTDFSVELDTLRAQEPKMSHAADRIAEVLTTLSTQVDALGNAPWGSDEPGGTFGAGYDTARQSIERSLRKSHTALANVAKGITSTVNSLQTQEDANTTSFGSCSPN